MSNGFNVPATPVKVIWALGVIIGARDPRGPQAPGSAWGPLIFWRGREETKNLAGNTSAWALEVKPPLGLGSENSKSPRTQPG